MFWLRQEVTPDAFIATNRIKTIADKSEFHLSSHCSVKSEGPTELKELVSD